MNNFWGWQPYYKLLDKMFGAIQNAQLQMVEFDAFPELNIYDNAVGARWIQDNAELDSHNLPNNGLTENVYLGICQKMQTHQLVGPHGECLATYGTQTAVEPFVATGAVFQDCTGVYAGESPMLEIESALMHAFAGDYFGPLVWLWYSTNLIDELPVRHASHTGGSPTKPRNRVKTRTYLPHQTLSCSTDNE